MRKTLLAMMLLSLIAVLPLHAQEAEQTDQLDFVNDNTIFLIDPAVQPATVEAVANVSGTIICTRAVTEGEALIISTKEFGEDAPNDGIYRLSRETMELQPLITRAELGDEIGDLLVNCPLVSPDGEWIAFRTRLESLDQGALYTMRPDGTEMRQLVPLIAYGADWYGLVEWSYDSAWMIFYGMIEGEAGYWRIR